MTAAARISLYPSLEGCASLQLLHIVSNLQSKFFLALDLALTLASSTCKAVPDIWPPQVVQLLQVFGRLRLCPLSQPGREHGVEGRSRDTSPAVDLTAAISALNC